MKILVFFLVVVFLYKITKTKYYENFEGLCIKPLTTYYENVYDSSLNWKDEDDVEATIIDDLNVLSNSIYDPSFNHFISYNPFSDSFDYLNSKQCNYL
tara:strand:- start:299 stop:592 length:294 start_codon:yes stop_codon:yes gene_type:complete